MSRNSEDTLRIPLPVVSDEPVSAATDPAGIILSTPTSPEDAGRGPGYGRAYWRSIEEKLGHPSLAAAYANEFPPGASEPPSGVARRDFLGLVGASLALAGAAGCTSRRAEKILPYTHTPREMTPGIPQAYATAHALRGIGTGILVESWEGRPTKVEGNPDHPDSLGRTGIFEQALTLQLYDPDRANLAQKGGVASGFRTFLDELAPELDKHQQDGGARLRFLVDPSSSPFLLELRNRILQRFPRARFVTYDSVSRENAYAGAQLAFGRPLEVDYDFRKADVILSLDGDFLQPLPGQIHWSLAYADRRAPETAKLNRLYVAESQLSVTGANADHRLRVKPSDVARVALAVLSRIPGSPVAGRARGATGTEAFDRWAEAVAKDLTAARGRSVVLAGETQPPVVHAIAHAINEALGNIGQTVQIFPVAVHDPASGPRGLADLVNEMNAGVVDTLVITAHNPVYTAPADLGFAGALTKVRQSIYLGLYCDETAQVANWFLPALHPLESWGDLRSRNGTVSIVQPLIQPLFSGMGEGELFATFADLRGSTYDLLRSMWQQRVQGGGFEDAWRTWLAVGVIPGTALQPESVSVDSSALSQAVGQVPPPTAGLELSLIPDNTVWDGRFANVSWCQELPDPITKLTWDNAAIISPATARARELTQGDLVTLSDGTRSMKAAILVVPGWADDTVTLALGYGRKVAGTVGKERGFDAGQLRTVQNFWSVPGITVEPQARLGTYKFSITQLHWSMEGRPIALDQTYAEYLANPNAETRDHKGMLPTLQEPVVYDGYKWGMNVDMSRCTGCATCMIACQAENNIPVVGKEQVANGREMHWLRVDRYFVGESVEDPQVNLQPMMCQHCETAPCEYVCPVNATVHSDEGLNEMVYNRCVGTRYCANNCPYKVRRFNYLHYTADLTPTQKMAMNPDVTVRDRGVMEKCTYCVQRIERVRIDARVQDRNIRDAELKTACQQACPTNAIVFGSLNPLDGKPTEVAQRAGLPRRYDVLHSLGTRPRTSYLVRIRNPNPELA